MIAASFNNEKSFQNALNNAFEHFINLSSRAPEYISLFMDDKLRKVQFALLVCTPALHVIWCQWEHRAWRMAALAFCIVEMWFRT